MQTMTEPTNTFKKIVPIVVKLRIGQMREIIAPKREFSQTNWVFCFINFSVVFNMKKLINKFSIKTYSITIFILLLCHILNLCEQFFLIKSCRVFCFVRFFCHKNFLCFAFFVDFVRTLSFMNILFFFGEITLSELF